MSFMRFLIFLFVMKQKMLSLHLSHIIVSSLPFVFKGFSSNEISDKKNSFQTFEYLNDGVIMNK